MINQDWHQEQQRKIRVCQHRAKWLGIHAVAAVIEVVVLSFIFGPFPFWSYIVTAILAFTLLMFSLKFHTDADILIQSGMYRAQSDAIIALLGTLGKKKNGN